MKKMFLIAILMLSISFSFAQNTKTQPVMQDTAIRIDQQFVRKTATKVFTIYVQQYVYQPTRSSVFVTSKKLKVDKTSNLDQPMYGQHFQIAEPIKKIGVAYDNEKIIIKYVTDKDAERIIECI